jgi:hypothetical protein
MSKRTITYPSGAKYEGEWKDGKMHGKGIFTRPKSKRCWWDIDSKTTTGSLGYKYEGEFTNGKKHCGFW